MLSLLAGPLVAQQKHLSLDDIYDPSRRVNFSGTPPAEVSWIDGSHFAWTHGARNGELVKVDAASGGETPLFDAGKMEAALAKLGVDAAEARRVSRARPLAFDAAYTASVVRLSDDLFTYSFERDRAIRLTASGGTEDQVSFSPDGSAVAFVRGNNLFVCDVETGRETAITSDGSQKVLNGRMDWVYEEELYGRGVTRAYWWSPDSTALAFLRIDDTPVPTYPVVDQIPYEQHVEQWDYPKAGDPNPVVTLGVWRRGGSAIAWVDTAKYPDADRLIVRVGWLPDSRRVVYAVQNRTQTSLDLNRADAATGKPDTLLHESSRHWIGGDDVEPPVWLPDGSFLWISDRSGWRHLYHYKADGSLIRQVTTGKWEMRTLHGADDSGWIYFSGTERSPIGGDVYRIRLDGSGLRRLSDAAGTHTAAFSRSMAYYTDTWSDATTPPQMRLRRNDGSDVRVLEANKAEALHEYRLSTPEFLQVTTRDGFVMEAMMIKPPDFDSSRRYPVYQFTYAGPHNQQVRNAWGGTQYMYHQLLAQQGIIVWICDNRTASGKGSESAWAIDRQFGQSELRDIEDGIGWLKKQPYVDGSRIGMHGWSYGGFMTSYALTHSTSFIMGIAGGTVADWRDYDSIYTERYMGLPQENADGYRRSSPRFAAADLHGALMLIHGAIDDNVHLANTMQFVYELQKAQKPFQLMLYPKSRHGVTDPPLVHHLRRTMFDFVMAQLKPEAKR
jgi:dipeptidyl-peptidase-4